MYSEYAIHTLTPQMTRTPNTTDRAVKPRSVAATLWPSPLGSVVMGQGRESVPGQWAQRVLGRPRHVRMLSNMSMPAAPNITVGVQAASMGWSRPVRPKCEETKPVA